MRNWSQDNRPGASRGDDLRGAESGDKAAVRAITVLSARSATSFENPGSDGAEGLNKEVAALHVLQGIATTLPDNLDDNKREDDCAHCPRCPRSPGRARSRPWRNFSCPAGISTQATPSTPFLYIYPYLSACAVCLKYS